MCSWCTVPAELQNIPICCATCTFFYLKLIINGILYGIFFVCAATVSMVLIDSSVIFICFSECERCFWHTHWLSPPTSLPVKQTNIIKPSGYGNIIVVVPPPWMDPLDYYLPLVLTVYKFVLMSTVNVMMRMNLWTPTSFERKDIVHFLLESGAGQNILCKLH